MNHLARFAFLLLVCPASAADHFVVVPFESMHFEGPAPEAADPMSAFSRFGWGGAPEIEAYVVLDGPGEAYLDSGAGGLLEPPASTPKRIAVRVPEAREISGRLFVIKTDFSGFEPHRFKIAKPTEVDPDAQANFYAVMESHYFGLCSRNLPGAAWFRHQFRVAHDQRASLPKPAGAPSDSTTGDEFDGAQDSLGLIGDSSTGSRTLDDTFDLFTGERALAENLDIARGLRVAKDEPNTIDVATIGGVTTRAMDWKALVKDLKPETDGLAKSIPADQHGVFFPTFDALVRVFDEIDHAGTPVLHFASARAQDQHTKERYQTQLCMPLSAIARMLGPAIVSSVAITGSDPYLPSGSDMALLFACKQPAVLETYLGVRYAEAKSSGAKAVDGSLGPTKYTGVRTDDRRVSSYTARFEDVIVVTNSLKQLERIAATNAGRTSALASTDEYVWFRDRYKKSDAGESALVVLSDATIRRWASPRDRIGNSRRVRAAAAMAEIQASAVDEILGGKIKEGASAADPSLPFSSDFVWTKRGVFSPMYGSLAFMTPLSELPVELVSNSEKRGYEAFRQAFQNLWSNFFDPIALRLSFADAQLAADLTVMPLAVTTEYREFIDLTRGATLAPTSGDGHAETLFHFALAFGSKSELSKMFNSGAGSFAKQFGADPLGWIGNGVAIYADRDPFWDEMCKADERSDFFDENFYRMPLALHVEVKDALKLAGFLTSLRALADGAAPGLAKWETKTWHEQGYVKLSAEEGVSEMADKAALYYAAMPDAFVLSLREDVVQHAIDRRAERKGGKVDPAHDKPWLGSSVAVRIDREAVDVVSRVTSTEIGDKLQEAAWSAIPILNEWKRRFPTEDPVAVHERLWNVALVSPAGGTFAWNEALQTMEASDYGSPAAPKTGPALPIALDRFTSGEFGLSFEGEGLRVRGELAREHK